MDYFESVIISPDADALFKVRPSDYTLGNKALEATLRYIAITRCDGDIGKAAIRASSNYFDSSSTGNYYAGNQYDNFELLILTSRYTATSLLSIDAEGWNILSEPPYPVSPYLSKVSETRVYINQERKRAIVIVRKATEKWITTLCSVLFRVLPWRFDPQLTEQDTALFQALNKGDVDKFVSVLNNACTNVDFRGAILKSNLIGWGSDYCVSRINYLEEDIRTSLSNIQSHERTISSLLNRISGNQVQIEALRAQKSENTDALYQFFVSRKQLSLMDIFNCRDGGKSLRFSITETLEYYDQDAFLRMYNNKNSDFFDDKDDPITKIFYAIFAENKGVFRVESIFQLDNLSNLSPLDNVRSGRFNGTHIPHPHLFHHGCLGGNSEPIHNHLINGDWDMAIDQAIAATKNLNFGDGIVLEEFIEDVRSCFDGYSSCKCIIADNNVAMTVKEFFEYIGGNKNEETVNG